MEYTIKAIPTVYKGRRYRSRLEAKWAAFFDHLPMWDVEYEPADLGKWSPDFLVRMNIDVFVEIKPITRFDDQVGDRVLSSIKGAAPSEKRWGIALFGTAPWADGEYVYLGWIYSPMYGGAWQPASIAWTPMNNRPGFLPALLPQDDDVTRSLRTSGYVEHTMSLWAQASNTVQWLPEDGG